MNKRMTRPGKTYVIVTDDGAAKDVYLSWNSEYGYYMTVDWIDEICEFDFYDSVDQAIERAKDADSGTFGGLQCRYEDGWIQEHRGADFYNNVCPVLVDLKEQLESLSLEQLEIVMRAIIHGYFHGNAAGQREKIREFKRVFDID